LKIKPSGNPEAKPKLVEIIVGDDGYATPTAEHTGVVQNKSKGLFT
jgi:hypothetical protein